MARPHVIQTRLDDEDMERLQRDAKAAGVSLAAYIRFMLKQRVWVPNPDDGVDVADSKTLSIRIDEEAKRQIQDLAAEDDRTVTNAVVRLIREEVRRRLAAKRKGSK